MRNYRINDELIKQDPRKVETSLTDRLYKSKKSGTKKNSKKKK